MQTIKRKLKSFTDLKFTIDLDPTGKVPANIADIIFSVKSFTDITTADNIIFLKKESTGGITKTSVGNLVTVLVQWAETEYSNFTVDTFYKAGLFLKFNGDPEANEHNNGIFNLVIEQDFLRE